MSAGAECVPKQSNPQPTQRCFPFIGGVSTRMCNAERVWSVIYLNPHNKELPEFSNEVEKTQGPQN